jgi:hypothetical protein
LTRVYAAKPNAELTPDSSRSFREARIIGYHQ